VAQSQPQTPQRRTGNHGQLSFASAERFDLVKWLDLPPATESLSSTQGVDCGIISRLRCVLVSNVAQAFHLRRYRREAPRGFTQSLLGVASDGRLSELGEVKRRGRHAPLWRSAFLLAAAVLRAISLAAPWYRGGGFNIF
jgi:hypothetical protein